MKKVVFIISTLFMMVGNTMAQDTLTSYYPKAGYFYNTWFHEHGYYSESDCLMPYNGYVYAIYFHTDDTLPIYGIGASLSTPDLTYDPETNPYPYPWVIDTSWKEVYEYLGLYRWVGDTLQTASDSLYVHMKETPVSYYFKWDRPKWIYSACDSVLPFYERYFDEPVMMTDTFLTGITMRTSWVVMHGVFPIDSFYIRPISLHAYLAWDSGDSIVLKGRTKYRHFDTIRYQIVSRDDNDLPDRFEMTKYPLIFPILTPPDTTIGDTTIIDTTIVDTTIVDTVGIADVQLVGRYVALQPNPASERVRVTSSFGLQRIEIYNAAGARVREERASGYTATLDLGTLPEGAYLVRVHTPAGSTTKKLVVQRR
ncbi:MAG: T9SS type A sorting domain-containing protein [Bacteroidales bacterium]|nr:T9SS type A sorting domain-containing protein [Bacteroidales bacterium]